MAFLSVIAMVVEKHGFGEQLKATSCAGVIPVIACLAKLDIYIKYILGPVAIGFASSIGPRRPDISHP
jgi:hypothetical protein